MVSGTRTALLFHSLRPWLPWCSAWKSYYWRVELGGGERGSFPEASCLERVGRTKDGEAEKDPPGYFNWVFSGVTVV